MTILSSQINDNIGQGGQIPQFIYLQTDNTVAEVSTAGYLSGIMSQGYIISDLQMAVISTKTSPGARVSSTNLYTIAVTDGVPTLTKVG